MINKRIDRAWSEAYNSNNYIKKTTNYKCNCYCAQIDCIAFRIK